MLDDSSGYALMPTAQKHDTATDSSSLPQAAAWQHHSTHADKHVYVDVDSAGAKKCCLTL